MIILRNTRDPRVAARNARFAAPPAASEPRTSRARELSLGAWDNEGGAAAPRAGGWLAGLDREAGLPKSTARPKQR